MTDETVPQLDEPEPRKPVEVSVAVEMGGERPILPFPEHD